MAPMNRMKNCIGILAMALNSRLSLLCAIVAAGEVALHLALVAAEVGEHEEHAADASRSRRCSGRSRSKRPDGRVEPAGGAGERERIGEASRPAGSSQMAVTSATSRPAVMMSICWKSVQVTALMPPETV